MGHFSQPLAHCNSSILAKKPPTKHTKKILYFIDIHLLISNLFWGVCYWCILQCRHPTV